MAISDKYEQAHPAKAATFALDCGVKHAWRYGVKQAEKFGADWLAQYMTAMSKDVRVLPYILSGLTDAELDAAIGQMEAGHLEQYPLIFSGKK